MARKYELILVVKKTTEGWQGEEEVLWERIGTVDSLEKSKTLAVTWARIIKESLDHAEQLKGKDNV